jgi:hypothetical protein
MSAFKTRTLTTELCYSDVIERLLQEEEFWAHEVLSGLVQAGLIPSKLSELELVGVVGIGGCHVCSVDVLGAAITRNDWRLVGMCLTHGPTPSEDALIHTLQRLLR